MIGKQKFSALVLGLSLITSLAGLGYRLGNYAIAVKEYERTVSVRGSAEPEVDADIVIWPIQFTLAGNELEALDSLIDSSNSKILAFLATKGIDESAVTLAPPAITDRLAQLYGNSSPVESTLSALNRI